MLKCSIASQPAQPDNGIVLALDTFLMARYRSIKKMSICADWDVTSAFCLLFDSTVMLFQLLSG
jgi:hypothetical protein